MGRLDGKVAVITGGGGGIGEATGELFWQEGASVVLVDNNAEDLEQAVRGISDSSERLLGVTANVADEAEAARAINATIERFGRLDVLANMAGVRTPVGPISEATPFARGS